MTTSFGAALAVRRRYTDMREFAVAADATVIGGLKPRFAIFRKLFSSL